MSQPWRKIEGALKRNQEAREVLYGAENDAKREKDIAGKIREESGQALSLSMTRYPRNVSNKMRLEV
ncbi:hypothetical protein RvY_00586 [Ramazzottius varieornatus]|uniref:Uncharacterized protein n=1 Tax=Ramazzottius varieornatus TaxID=947166 RepID=A0A1D1UNP5_RAMVA|nr:hypothetical protein RvY_00586 [Ramazzottius varieornatus]